MQGTINLTPNELANTGYTDLSLVCETERFTIYRALTHDGQHVLVKAPTSTRPPVQLIRQLEHELEIAADLNQDYVIRPIKIEWIKDHKALVLEECAYSPLTELLQTPLTMAIFLPIAIGITAALSEVHRHGLVHREIQPDNIFAQSTGQVKLTGFGVASRLTSEQRPPSPAEISTGTLAYMAPEQTGRMNRSVDTRSDLYALGVTFYRMLTGRTPFTASGPMEWVHCHLAIQPKPPKEYLDTIPEPLSELVMKLLAKTPEERYQTVLGLKADLEHCHEEWREQGRITPFPLGVRDISNRLQIPEKLYGRKREVEMLLAAFNRVAAGGKTELVLVSGYSGIGKSAVVNELFKALDPQRAFFATGKFDQYKRGIPYSTLAQALHMLIAPLLGKSETELGNWRRIIQQALEPNGQLMVDLVPELKFIIGEQAPIPELEPQQAKARFQLAIRYFIGVFARAEHPLLLFIDDLQWLDAATLDLIEILVTHEDVRHLCLIGAYRSNEVGPNRPLARKLEAIRNAKAQVTEIKLTALTLGHLTRMVKDTLQCELERAKPLAELVHDKTAGNPFFTIQFLTALAQEGMLAFDHGKGQWSWDMNRIQAESYTDNVADLIATKLARLPSDVQQAVQQFACLGNTAQTKTLSLVLGSPEKEVDAVLQEAVDQEVLQRFGDSYRFVHDRVQEAAYALIPKASLAWFHLRIGRLLFAHTSQEMREEAIFEIVSQLNSSRELIVSRNEREELASLNLLAAKRAKGSAAYVEALGYLTVGASLLEKECWELQHGLAFALEIDWAECEFQTGELETAERHLTELSPHATSTLERADIASLRIDLYMTLGQIGQAVAIGLDYLRHLGIEWTVHPTSEEARREYDRIWSLLGSRAIEDLIDLPIMSDPIQLATMEVLTKLRPPALFTDVNLVSMVICKAVNLSLQHGNTHASCFAYASLGIVAGPRFGNYAEAYRFGKLAYDLVEQRGLKRFQARTYTNFGSFIIPWAKHIRAGRDLLQRAFDVSSRSSDIIYGGYASNNLVANLLLAGAPLVEAEQKARIGLEFVQKARFGLVADIITSQLGLIHSLRGLTRQFGAFDDDQFDERQFEEHFSGKPDLAVAECFHWIRKLQSRFMAGDYAVAIEASEKAEPLLWTSRPFIEMAEYYFYAALSNAAGCDSTPESQRQEYVTAISAQLQQLESWAQVCPENFENRAALVGAEIARIEERPLDAMRLYEKAIQSARANDFIHSEALAHELAGRFYLSRGLEVTGYAHLHQARTCYTVWGANGKKQQLDRLYPQLDGQLSHLASPSATMASPQLDLATVAKVSQTVSGEIELPNLIEALMTSALENAGADRGLLILAHDGGFEVEVEANAYRPGVEVRLIRTSIDERMCPEHIINNVIHTREYVILDDATRPGEFAEDLYLQQGIAKSILCLPLLRQGNLAGVLYLENTQATGAFTPDRVVVLDLMAAQAAISLENARLYNDLRESEAKFRALVQKIQAAVVVHGADTRILISNSMAQELLGLSDNQLMGKSVIDPAWHFFREDGSRMPQEEYPVNRVLASRRALQNYVVGVHRPELEEDIWALVSAIPVFDATNEIEQVIVTFTDITEQKKQEQQLVESEQLFRTLVENSPDHIARYDRQLNRIYINPALQQMFQAPIGEVLVNPPMVASPLQNPERYMANLKRAIETKQEHSDELAFRHKDGATHWAQMRFAPEFDQDGEIASVLAISHDITPLKKAEQERLVYLSFLENLDRINRLLQGEGDIAQVMNKVLDEVLDIFACDRAFLGYPCDPDAATWSIPMESTRPEYPGAGQLGPQPMNKHVSRIMRTLLASNHALCMGPGAQYPVPASLRKQFNIRSLMSTILRPREDKPWYFGILQCSCDRVWTDQETRLFEEISNRLSSGLNDLLITRNLRESEERFRLVYENSPIPTWEEDFSAVKLRLDELNQTQGDDLENYLIAHPEIVKECATLVRIINVNSAALELHEATCKEELYDGLPKIFIDESYVAFRQELMALAKGQTELLLDGTVQTLNGTRREVSVSFSVCPGYEQSLTKVFVSRVDITQRKHDEDQLRLAASVFSTSQEGILISNADNRIINVNPAFTRLTGYSLEEAIGQNPGFLSAGKQNQAFYDEMWQSINTHGEWQGELWNRRKSGEVYPELLSIIAVKDERGQLQHYVGAFSDISAIKQHEADLDRIAHYDVLTSVPNRRLLGERVEQAIAYTRRHGKNLAVCYLDLDGFKPINDQFGHEGGDRMLIEIARRLESMSRGEDTVARLGGDEFVLLWKDIVNETDCIRALERILEKVAEPMLLDGEPVSVSASIGVTLYPDDNVDADNLLRHADHAMYTAKQLGKNRYQLFDARLERQISAQAELLSRIANGIEENQFELYYQPKVDYTEGRVIGVEALLRWNDPILGTVGPKEFLTLIENDSLAFRMGRWVLEEAVRQAKTWDDIGITLPISINIFPRHLKYLTFIDDLRNAIELHWPEIPKNRLLLEIVETAELEELEPIEAVIKQCLEIGIGFSLDDFGTGYSSLVYLRRLSIEELKIDQSFVRDMLDDKDDEAIVIGVISLGQAFGLRVVAEGVESARHAQHLVNLGCSVVQGYEFGRPMSAHQFQKWYTHFLQQTV